MTTPSMSMLTGATALGHVAELRSTPLSLLERFNRECGDLGQLRFAYQSVVIVNSPSLVGELLVEKARSFRKSRFIRAMLHPFVGDGLFTSEGDLWRRQRKVMAPIFHPTNLGTFADAMTGAATRCVDTWQSGQVVDVSRETTRIAMSVAGTTLFGIDTFDEADELGEALTVALRWASEASASLGLLGQVELSFGVRRVARWLRIDQQEGTRARRLVDGAVERLERPILLPGRRTSELRRAIAVLDERVARMIADRRASAMERPDLLTRLLVSRDEQGRPMSDRQLRDEILTLFVAGHETTATALAWAFYLLARHPDALARLESEVAELGGRLPTPADLPRLGYALAVFKESLRMYPPVPYYEREALEPVEIANRDFAPGTYFGVLPWAIHHRADWWPEPRRFDPLRHSPELEEIRPRYAYIPFGAGPRVCIGNHFALMEGPLVLATIVQRARLVPESPREVLPDPVALTFRPLGGIPMRAHLRSRPLGSPRSDSAVSESR